VSGGCRSTLPHTRLERDQRAHAAGSRFLLLVPARLPHGGAGAPGTTATASTHTRNDPALETKDVFSQQFRVFLAGAFVMNSVAFRTHDQQV